MSIFNIFKPKWAAKHMSENDRRKLFWYLKRKSSYTAWEGRAAAFDTFAEVFERQVKEEPVFVEAGVDSEWATHWDQFYMQVLKAQVLYEQGLARLRVGDRSVWRYNERGVFLDALNIQNYWWTALVNHGPYGDVHFQGKYVEEMTKAIDNASSYVKATAGIVESMQAEPPAHEFWSEEAMDRLIRTVPFPENLPDVSAAVTDVTVHTGHPVPCYGIYEPQVPDGCMNYLLEGAFAPQAVNVDEADGGLIVRHAVWRLIWEDTRYLDGIIPVEEQSYFPLAAPMKATPPIFVDHDPLIQQGSDQLASRTGVWVLVHKIDVRQHFRAGEKLPQYEGRDVTWIWTEKG
ncbi:Imm72 family immunity protein [Massilia sp. CFBP 13647]|uniref:Imm72 family immunity protein n=2 Tax=unclassified Massilia TaxID=2609279 RepID=UPI001A7E3267